MRPLHWLLAILGAGFIHLALAYGFALNASRPVDSTISAANQGVTIQLSMQSARVEPESKPESQPEPTPPAKPQTEKQPEKAVPTPVKPKPKPKPIVVNVAKVEPSPKALLVRQKEPEKAIAENVFETSSPAQSPSEQALASVAKTMQPHNQQSAPGAQSALETAEYTAAKNDYFARLMGTLQRNKRYPKEAKKKKEQGTVMLQFSINKRGEVMAANISASSGHVLLDDAALQMLRKASPLPSIPDSLAQEQLEITIPVEYSLITK